MIACRLFGHRVDFHPFAFIEAAARDQGVDVDTAKLAYLVDAATRYRRAFNASKWVVAHDPTASQTLVVSAAEHGIIIRVAPKCVRCGRTKEKE